MRFLTVIVLIICFFTGSILYTGVGYADSVKKTPVVKEKSSTEKGFVFLNWIEYLLKKIFGSKQKKYRVKIPIPPPPPPPVFNSTIQG